MLLSIILWLTFVILLSMVVLSIMSYILGFFITSNNTEMKENNKRSENKDTNNETVVVYKRDRTGLFICLAIFIIVILTSGTMAYLTDNKSEWL